MLVTTATIPRRSFSLHTFPKNLSFLDSVRQFAVDGLREEEAQDRACQRRNPEHQSLEPGGEVRPGHEGSHHGTYPGEHGRGTASDVPYDRGEKFPGVDVNYGEAHGQPEHGDGPERDPEPLQLLGAEHDHQAGDSGYQVGQDERVLSPHLLYGEERHQRPWNLNGGCSGYVDEPAGNPTVCEVNLKEKT